MKVVASINIRLAALAITGAAMVGGCHRPAAQAPAAAGSVFSEAQFPTRKENWQTSQIPTGPQADAPIKTGAPPLVYLTAGATTIRISDLTTGQELLPALEVPARTLISVNSGAGVTVGGATVHRGPLADDHQYGIFLVSPGTNEFRTGTIREGRPPLPEVQPPPTSQPGGVP